MLYRTRTNKAIIRYGLYLYFSSSRSFRLAAKSLTPIKKRSMYLSGNRWVQKYADCAADRFRTHKPLIKEIFVDETLLHVEEVRTIG
jgi:hypothetical protein